MTAGARREAAQMSTDEAHVQRLKIAGQLVKDEMRDRSWSREKLAEEARIHPSSVTQLTNGKYEGAMWRKVARALGWGNFLEYVRSGSVDAIAGCAGVPEETRELAIVRLREIANRSEFTTGLLG